MTYTNQQLCQLIIEAGDSDEKAEALSLAIAHLGLEKRLPKSQIRDYDEVLKRTQEVVREIHNFYRKIDPKSYDCQNESQAKTLTQHFMRWVKRIFDYKRIDVYRHRIGIPSELSLDQPLPNNDSDSRNTVGDNISDKTLTGLEAIGYQQEADTRENTPKKLLQYIDEDPDNKLKECCVKGHEECHAQVCLQLWFLNENFKILVNQELESLINLMRRDQPRITNIVIEEKKQRLKPQIENDIFEQKIKEKVEKIEEEFNISILPAHRPEYDYNKIASIFGVKYRQIYELIGIPQSKTKTEPNQRRRSRVVNLLNKVFKEDIEQFFNQL
ncbi:MAG: hypothetical protein DSM107014_02655 [Gomphosphaeria aponina SAG 52.96 = DSM 107014]|uniref:Uncharacterized protein n=1 Tax=Gomphosphaeria aponina SAG 52.96 = DSM 107014 TaxID=1521640 RepID=A0A941JRD9_9CHRO|nr:hypothetical protein [Gomphosphaeria aponina SAG 52.96 = DSM 107014]